MPWNDHLNSPAGGWQRLEEKLNQADADQHQELQFWRVAASVLLVSVCLAEFYEPKSVLKSDNSSAPLAVGDIRMENGQATPVGASKDGVQVYWILSN